MNQELKQLLHSAILTLPIRTAHIGRMIDRRLVDCEVRFAVLASDTSLYKFHESVPHDGKGMVVQGGEVLRIIQDISVGPVPVRAAKIAHGEVDVVRGFDEGMSRGAMEYAAMALLIGYLACTKPMTVEGGMSIPFVKI